MFTLSHYKQLILLWTTLFSDYNTQGLYLKYSELKTSNDGMALFQMTL